MIPNNIILVHGGGDEEATGSTELESEGDGTITTAVTDDKTAEEAETATTKDDGTSDDTDSPADRTTENPTNNDEAASEKDTPKDEAEAATMDSTADESATTPATTEAVESTTNTDTNTDDKTKTTVESKSPTKEYLVKGNDKRIERMARWMFTLYDAYQKKGIVARDTLHRFLSDVHGEDCYKTPPIRTTLDRVFSQSHTLTPREFADSVCDTMTLEPRLSHVLLDWMAHLSYALEPRSGGIAKSTIGFLKQIDQELSLLPQICEQVLLAESRLYEIKRRFHSMVESGSTVIQGDPMSEEDDEELDDPQVDVVQEASMGRSKPQLSGTQQPKHVISKNAFCKAVCPQNDELGHGGYLPQSVALQVFSSIATNDQFWDLTHVLRFGGTAVRSDEKSLIQWIVRMVGDGRQMLNRQQLCQLIVCLCEHWEFRSHADASKEVRESQSGGVPPRRRSILEPVVAASEDSTVKMSTAIALELYSKTNNGNAAENRHDAAETIRAGNLVDKLLSSFDEKKATITTDELLQWHGSDTETPKDRRRLGPLMMELRVIASVLFGVPPRLASIECAIVAELQHRHKSRYPQREASRRGPRGTVWYLIDDRWFKRWNNLIKRVSLTENDADDLRDKPGVEGNPRRLERISNTVLLRENGSLALRSDIKWRHDYDLLPPLVWSALQAWYDGGPPIYRSVVPYIHNNAANPHARGAPRIRTESEIELYPLFVSVFMCDVTSRGEARPFQQKIPVSRVTPVRVLLLQLCNGLEIDPDLGRLWVMDRTPPSSITSSMRSISGSSILSADDDSVADVNDWLLDLDKSIVEQRQQHGSGPMSDKQIATLTLLLEVKDDESGKWPRGIDGKQWEFRDKKEPQSALGDGVVGLYNMGNTCYLNSSIQCLSHTPIFRDYFNAKCYLNDINTSNPLGHKGELAQVSAVLINSLWKRFNQQQTQHTHMSRRIIAPGSYAPVNAPALTPKTFKESLGRFSEHFSGNEQHDAQELLAFLLGGLSEDLNRIVDKPYIEAPDSDGRPDGELADIWWSNHLKREMSIIVALFTGQYKSLLTCRSCKYESARFEPFSFLQLPLPEDDHMTVSLILYPARPGIDIMKYSLRVKDDGTLYDVLIALAKVLHTDEIAEANADVSGTAGSDENATNTDAVARPSGSSDADDTDSAELQALYEKRAKDMAVVDLREGYIFKIAPNHWSLSALQHKDTGELPIFHIYELDPIPDSDEAEDENKQSQSTASETAEATKADDVKDNTDDDADDDDDDATKRNGANNENRNMDDSNSLHQHASDKKKTKLSDGGGHIFLAIAQRRSEEVARYLLHPLSHRVFGTPMLLRIATPDEGLTGSQLYDIIARRLVNFVPKSALKFLNNETSIDSEPQCTPATSGTKSENDDGNGDDQIEALRMRLKKTMTDMEDVAAGNVPRYGFRLRLANRDGKRCVLCPWYECCIGCLVPDDDKLCAVLNGDSVVVDWHLAVDLATSGFGSRQNQIDQASSNGMAPRSRFGVAVKNHPSCGVGTKKRGYADSISLEDCLDQFAKEEKIPEAYCSKCKDFRVQTKTMSLWRLPPIVIIQLKRFQFTQHMRRKLRDFVSFPIEGLDLSRIMSPDSNSMPTVTKLDANQKTRPDTDGSTAAEENADATDNGDGTATDAETDENGGSPLAPETGRSEMLYDLYAVVHHQGALSGGHYVASLKSEIDGNWRLFNDAQIFEIHSRDVVDSSAYILFYIRRDVKNANLSDFWDTTPREDGEAVSEEDMDKLIRGRSDRCVIS